MDEKKKINWTKILVISGSFFVVLLLLGAGTLYWYGKNKKGGPNSDVVATVFGKEITVGDVNKALYGINFGGTMSNPNQNSEAQKKEVIDQLVEKEIIFKVAKEQNLTATEAEINKELTTGLETGAGVGDGLGVFASYTAAQKAMTLENSRFAVLKQKVKEKNLAWLNGSYLLVRYDKYSTDIPKEAQFPVSSATERKRLSDEQYAAAEKMAQDLSQKINSGLSFEEASNILV